MPRTPARKGDNLNFNGAKFINNFKLKLMRQEIEKEIEKLKNTPFKKIYKTKKLIIDQHTKSGNIYINLKIRFDLNDHTTGLYFNIYLNGKKIENFSKEFRQYYQALLMFQKIKKMIKTFISNL